MSEKSDISNSQKLQAFDTFTSYVSKRNIKTLDQAMSEKQITVFKGGDGQHHQLKKASI